MSTMELDGLEIPGGSAPVFGGYGAGPTETETRAAIAEIEDGEPIEEEVEVGDAGRSASVLDRGRK